MGQELDQNDQDLVLKDQNLVRKVHKVVLKDENVVHKVQEVVMADSSRYITLRYMKTARDFICA